MRNGWRQSINWRERERVSESIKSMTTEVQSKKGRIKEEGGREGGRKGKGGKSSYFTRSVLLLFQ